MVIISVAIKASHNASHNAFDDASDYAPSTENMMLAARDAYLLQLVQTMADDMVLAAAAGWGLLCLPI